MMSDLGNSDEVLIHSTVVMADGVAQHRYWRHEIRMNSRGNVALPTQHKHAACGGEVLCVTRECWCDTD